MVELDMAELLNFKHLVIQHALYYYANNFFEHLNLRVFLVRLNI
jgi:hypothetical protein